VATTTTYSRSVDIDAPIETLSRFHLDTRRAPPISPDGAKAIEISEDSPVDPVRQLRLHITGPRTPLGHAWRVRIAALGPDRLADPVRDRRQLKAIFDVLRLRTRTLFEARARLAR
jgi:hypothetical protein